jgi:hypothetical protein
VGTDVVDQEALQRAERRGDAGAAEQELDRSEIAQRRRHLGDLLGLRPVSTLEADVGDRRLRHVDHVHSRAELSEDPRGRLAHPRRRARDHRGRPSVPEAVELPDPRAPSDVVSIALSNTENYILPVRTNRRPGRATRPAGSR